MTFEPDLERQFRVSRVTSLSDVNLNTFWAMAIIVMAFSGWDWFVDAAHWRAAFSIRLAGAVMIVATGFYQKLPGRRRSMPLMAKLRFVVAVMTTSWALGVLDHGLEEGIAGLVVVFLITPYIAIESSDLLKLNAVALAGVAAVVFSVRLDRFTRFNVGLHLLLAVSVSALLARVLESSNRRAFLLELQMSRDARTDALTGVPNRRAVEERAALEMRRAARTRGPVAVIMGDIDHFKRVNDRYGHHVGDAGLRVVAEALRGVMRQTDAIGRWGGEEFIALLPDTDVAAATDVAERMRLAVQNASYSGIPGGLTISLGVGAARVRDATPVEWAALVKDADDCLYRAKSDGRNRVVATRGIPAPATPAVPAEPAEPAGL